MAPPFDPLNNPRTSQVLFQMVLGVNTPTTIARELRLDHSTVIEHFRRLERLGAVGLGEKAGKQRHYAINWNKLAEISIRRAIGGSASSKMLEPWKDKKLQLFVRSYFETRVKNWERITPETKVLDEIGGRFSSLIDELRSTVVNIMSSATMKDERQYEKKGDIGELIVLLKHWAAQEREVPKPCRIAFKHAIDECAALTAK